MAVLPRLAAASVVTAILGGCGGFPTMPVPSMAATGIATTALTVRGQSVTFLSSPAFATDLELQPGARYLLAVVNTNPSSATTEDFTLAGTFVSGAVQPVTSAQSTPRKRRVIRYTAAPTAAPPRYDLTSEAARRIASLRRLEQPHVEMLERDAHVFQTYHDLRTSSLTGRSAGRATDFPPGARTNPSTIGTVQRIYIAKTLATSCTGVDSIGARAVAVGQHVVVLADTNRAAWPVRLRPDSSFYQSFADEYDAVTWPHIETYVGNPLSLDDRLSNMGKVTVVLSPVLNQFAGGIVAFVDACDFNRPTPGRSLDNDTEVFYYWTPEPALGWTVEPWEALLRATAAHETKHLVSFADRIINNDFRTPESIWLEEGLAQESSEIWERHFNRATWKGHATFDQTVGCEVYLGAAGSQCDVSGAKPLALSVSHLPFLFDYLQEESAGPAGHGLGTDTPSNYGAGWQFARWATDQYGSTEPSFIKSLINEPTLSGLPNLAKHTGRSIPELLVYWSLASAIFDTTTFVAGDIRTTNPSFDFGNIFFMGQAATSCSGTPCGFFSGGASTVPIFPVQPVIDSATSGMVETTVIGVPGTAAYYILLVAPAAGRERLELQSAPGGPIATSSDFRVGILRVE